MYEPIPMKMIRLDKELPLPAYAFDSDAGLDIYSAESGMLTPGERKPFPTGLKIAIPIGYEVQVRPRSGLAFKHGISIVNAPGTIDAGFRGEIKVILINHGKESYEVKRGDRIAQLVLKRVERAQIQEVEDFDHMDVSKRGEGGYGHTGR